MYSVTQQQHDLLVKLVEGVGSLIMDLLVIAQDPNMPHDMAMKILKAGENSKIQETSKQLREQLFK